MMVSSLVQMQSRSLADDAACGILKSAIERIHVIGRVHDRLTRRAGAVVIDARDFLCGLCVDLRSAIVGSRPVALRCDVDSHVISHSQAVSLGLIANELITNAVKYAFLNDRDGTVRVAFERRGDEFVFRSRTTASACRPQPRLTMAIPVRGSAWFVLSHCSFAAASRAYRAIRAHRSP